MRSFFAFLERHGAATVFASELERSVEDPNVRDLLRRERIVRDAPRAKGWPCNGDACERAVVERRGGKLVAVCTREPPACEMVDLGASDLAQIAISQDALLEIARRVTRADAPERPTTAGDLALVGTRTGGPRVEEIWLTLRPWSPKVRAWLAKRERAPVATRVLVPTRAALGDDDLLERGAASRVTIEVLAETWTVRGGKIAAARALRLVAADPEAEPSPAPARGLRIPRAKRWRDYDFHLVDPDTVLVRAGGEAQRFTHGDLGMAWTKSRKPKKTWELLVLLCEGGGMFRWKKLGTFGNARKVVSELRGVLRDRFGVADDPFEPFSYQDQWRAKFRAWPEPPGDD